MFFVGGFIGLFTKKDINVLRNKTDRIISREKAKQEKIVKKETLLLNKEKSKQNRIDEKKLARQRKKELKLERANRKRQAILEKKNEKERRKANNKLKVKKSDKVKKVSEAKQLKEQARLAKYETKAKAKSEKAKREEELLKEKLERENIEKKGKKKSKDDSVTLKQLTFSEKFANFIKNVNEFPAKVEKFLREKYENTSYAKNQRNKLDLNRQALLIEFKNKTEDRSNVKMMYEYVVKDKDGKIIKGYADGFSKVEIHSYLLSEGYEVYSIRTNKWIQAVHGGAASRSQKMKIKDLIFFSTQLSTYLKSGITLIESLKILSRQYKKKSYKTVFKMIIYDLSMGESFSKTLENRGETFPSLFVTMIKTSEMTGELPEVLDDMADYYTETEKTRKQMITAMMYPSIVFVFAIAVLTFIMLYVIPKFVGIYDSMEGVEIPGITKFIIALSNFMKSYTLYIFIGVVLLIIVFRMLYRKNKSFRTFVQWSLMHIPVINNIIIYKEVTMFTKTFSSLLAHNVFITDSMEILSRVTQNEIYRSLIFNTVTNLARGERLSAEFDGHWAFPIPAYEMIVTGERTGQLPEMMAKVAAYYQELHSNSVTRIKTFIEPALIIFLTAMVGVIVLSIVLPIFNMYQAVQNL